MNLQKYIIALFSLGVVLSSCRRLAVHHTKDVKVEKKEVIVLKNDSLKTTTVLKTDTVKENPIKFEYLSARGKMDYRDKEMNFSANFNLRIRKDSIIWISVSTMGVEGARCLLTKDSLYAIDKINKTSYAFGYDYLHKEFGILVNYDKFQSVLLGNMFVNQTFADSVFYDGNYKILKHSEGDFIIDNYVNKENLKLEKLLMLEQPLSNSMIVNYADMRLVDIYLFPFSSNFSLKYLGAKGLQNTSVVLDYTKVDLNNKELRFPFTIPNRIERNKRRLENAEKNK